MDALNDILTLARQSAEADAEIVRKIKELLAAQALTLPQAQTPIGQMDPDVVSRPIAWGAKVSSVFRARIWWAAVMLHQDPDHLMSCIAFETGETFSAKVRNGAGSGAIGLIQFMPSTAAALGTSTAALAAMEAEDQITWVYKYLRPFAGRLNTLADSYMAILMPKYVGMPDDSILFSGGTAYRQNSGLDANKDGRITKLEASAKVMQKLAIGRRPDMMA